MRPCGGSFNGLAGMGHFSIVDVKTVLGGSDISMDWVVCSVSMDLVVYGVSMDWMILVFQWTW